MIIEIFNNWMTTEYLWNSSMIRSELIRILVEILQEFQSEFWLEMQLQLTVEFLWNSD